MILLERPIAKSNVEEYIERENLESVASQVISKSIDQVYTGVDPAGVELHSPLPELSDDWEVPD